MPLQFDPFHYHRQSIRYKNWDYRTPGYYFITICTNARQPFFEDPAYRDIIEMRIQKIARFAKHAHLDEWVVMPDHAHLNLWLIDWPQSKSAEPEKRDGLTNAQSGSIGAIVGNLKSQVTREINQLRDGIGNSVWQRGYWDRIVRNDDELNRIRHYIRMNPLRCHENRDGLDTLLQKMIFHP